MDENTRELLDFEKEKRVLEDYYIAFQKTLNGQGGELTEEEKAIFEKDLFDINSKKATLRVLCRGLGIDVPEKFEAAADDKMKVKFRPEYIKKGEVCLILRSAEDFKMKRTTSKDQLEQALEKGAKLVIMGRQEFVNCELNEEDYPVILVDDLNARMLRLFAMVRKQHNEKVVMIT